MSGKHSSSSRPPLHPSKMSREDFNKRNRVYSNSNASLQNAANADKRLNMQASRRGNFVPGDHHRHPNVSSHVRGSFPHAQGKYSNDSHSRPHLKSVPCKPQPGRSMTGIPPNPRMAISNSSQPIHGSQRARPRLNIPTPMPCNFDGSSYPLMEPFDNFEKMCKVGKGTFGEVTKCRSRENKKFYALKKILMENEHEGFPITAIREISILKALNHQNIVRLISIAMQKDSHASINSPFKDRVSFYLVFEYCEHDLAGLLCNPAIVFTTSYVKSIMKQLFNGLEQLHKQHILHRDMKAANILITKKGVLKIADFGLARYWSATETSGLGEKPRLTNRVVTLWYRPPEVLLGDRSYTSAIDIWGAGCIMAEMFTRQPIMQGEKELEQLKLIYQLCGSVTEGNWPDAKNLDFFEKMDMGQQNKRVLREKLSRFIGDEPSLDLVDRILQLNPKRRPTADQVLLDLDYFWIEPYPGELGELLANFDSSMYEMFADRYQRGAAQMAQLSGKPILNASRHQNPGASGNIGPIVKDRVY